MKAVKLSLAAALVASSAFAVENFKVDGFAKLWYETSESTKTGQANMFKGDTNSVGNLVAKIKATGDLHKNVGFGATVFAATTMGLENDAVGATALPANGNNANPFWLGEAYITYSVKNTLAKIGRQELDTPLAYSEICSCGPVPNTFEAALLVNKDLPDTTLLAAFVSKGNGQGGAETGDKGLLNGVAGMNTDGTFASYHGMVANAAVGAANVSGDTKHAGGAYAVGAINTSIPNLTIVPFYYNINNTANATWLEATYNLPSVVKVQAMYANVAANGVTKTLLNGLSVTDTSTDAYAAQASVNVSDIELSAAYSKTTEGFIPVANTANNFATSKVYTAGHIGGTFTSRIAGAPDTTGYKLQAKTTISDVKLGAAYHNFDLGSNAKGGGTAGYYNALDATALSGLNPSAVEVYATTKFDVVNLLASYTNESEIAKDGTKSVDQQTLRVVARIDF